MEWLGCISLIILLYYSSYPERIRKLEKRVKILEKKQKGDCEMSKIINDLIGRECKIKTEEALLFAGKEEVMCRICDADEEWIKFTYKDKKNNNKTKILRIESIDNIELIG